MVTLPSGLLEYVTDDENLCRFLTQSNHHAAGMAKPAAFLPSPRHRNTSVFRMGKEPERLVQMWKDTVTGDRTLKGVAFLKAAEVRATQLDVVAAEPPPTHANIEGWPWLEQDPAFEKARQKELACQLASNTTVLLL